MAESLSTEQETVLRMMKSLSPAKQRQLVKLAKQLLKEKCPYCYSAMPREALRQHVADVHGDTVCPNCKRKLTKDFLTAHLRTCNKSKQKGSPKKTPKILTDERMPKWVFSQGGLCSPK